mmetsp:Transcript_24020/g.68357  ORF Transcript_24020/g.68357 Transcript_24020/m.68357 type:complete len:98 (-) Transcript_24020:7-300(-)
MPSQAEAFGSASVTGMPLMLAKVKQPAAVRASFTGSSAPSAGGMGRGLKAAGTAKSGRCKPGGGDTGDMGAAVDIMAGWSVWESLRLSRAAVSWLET